MDCVKSSKLGSSSRLPSVRRSPKCFSLFWSSSWTFLCIFQLVVGVLQDLPISPIMTLSLCSCFTNSRNYESELCDSVLGSHFSLREEQVNQRNFLAAGWSNSTRLLSRTMIYSLWCTHTGSGSNPPTSTWELLFRNKAAYVWRWPFTSLCCLSEDHAELICTPPCVCMALLFN